jgi:hypothetical protein
MPDPSLSARSTGMVPHLHIWQFVHNARGTWLWHCSCGAYRNADGRQTA